MKKHKHIYRGVTGSPGIGIGVARIFYFGIPEIPVSYVSETSIKDEIKRFHDAVEEALKEVSSIESQVNRDMGEDLLMFMSIQKAILKDTELIKQTENLIKKYRFSAEYSLKEVAKKYQNIILSKTTPFMKERLTDVKDAIARVIFILMGKKPKSIVEAPPETVVVTHDLPPSEAVLLSPERIKGIVCEVGGITSHTALIARALDIPAVVGVKKIVNYIEDETDIIVDGNRGHVIVSPTEKTKEYYRNEKIKFEEKRHRLILIAEKEPFTADGKYIDVSANIEFSYEVETAKKYGAKGIGLFRTEYLFLTRRSIPTEEEQFHIYKYVAESFKPNPVIIRTLDIGGDKVIPGYHEANPFLGWRGIRFSLDNPFLFKSQIKAIMRAALHGNVKMMVPMVSTIEEVRKLKKMIRETTRELEEKGIKFDKEFEIGIMIEVPSAVLLADKLGEMVNFFSIGSNDLTQYTLAIDRGSEMVSSLYNHLHPAVLKLIKMTVESAHRNNIWIGVCGEIAADPWAIPILVGLGIDELSMNPASIPLVKKIIQEIDTRELKPLIEKTLGKTTPTEVKRLLRNFYRKRYPSLFELIKNG